MGGRLSPAAAFNDECGVRGHASIICIRHLCGEDPRRARPHLRADGGPLRIFGTFRSRAWCFRNGYLIITGYRHEPFDLDIPDEEVRQNLSVILSTFAPSFCQLPFRRFEHTQRHHLSSALHTPLLYGAGIDPKPLVPYSDLL